MNVSSVKNLNGETFSAVQDVYLTDVVSNNSANWNEISAYQANSGTFLTAHQDLSDYQLTADMTAYQPAGDYMTTADSANFYTTANESGFISEVPAGTMNESAFSYDASDNITAYNGSAFKAGDEFPQSATEAIETVTANSADWNGTTETVSSNSGVWGGSALPISAGPGIKLEMNDGKLVASVSSEWIDITTACTLGAYVGNCSVYVNPAARICWLAGAFSPSNTGNFLTVPVEYKWLTRFEAANHVGHYLDFNTVGDGNVVSVRDGAGTYWSQTIMWGY